METQAVQLYDRIQDPVAAVEKLGGFFAKSGMFGCEKQEAGMILALACMAERKSPIELTRTYHIVDGKLSKKALAIHAEFREKGGKVKWLTAMDDAKKAEAEFAFEGQTIRGAFTIEEAKAQGLIRSKSAWEKTPSNMLRARLLSNAIAMLCPEIVAGVSGTPEDENDAPQSQEPKPIFPNAPSKASPEPKVVSSTPAPAPEVAPAKVEVTGAPSEPVDVEFKEITEAEFVPLKKAELLPNGHLSARTIQTLQFHIGSESNWLLALAWWKAKGKITTDNVSAELGVAMAQKIIDSPEKFRTAIGAK